MKKHSNKIKNKINGIKKMSPRVFSFGSALGDLLAMPFEAAERSRKSKRKRPSFLESLNLGSSEYID